MRINNFSSNSEIRYVGGCIRKIIQKELVDDIDLATNLNPQQVCEALKKNNINYYLDDIDSFKSSNSLETSVNEYTCQGLELDYSGICWGFDFTWSNKENTWTYRKARGAGWQNVHKVDVKQNAKALKRLNIAAEKAKKNLSSSTTTSIEIDSLIDGVDYTHNLSRAKFEQLADPILKRTIDPINRLLADAKMSKSDIHEIVLVGGTTRIPRVQQLLSDYFGGKNLNKSLNPDEAIAYGAAVQAAILTGQGNEKTSELLLLDVAPL